MESCLENWVHLPHVIKVDAKAQSISFQQAFGCVVISAHGRTCVKVVQAYALPPSFVPIRLAHQVLPSPLTSHSSCYNFSNFHNVQSNCPALCLQLPSPPPPPPPSPPLTDM